MRHAVPGCEDEMFFVRDTTLRVVLSHARKIRVCGSVTCACLCERVLCSVYRTTSSTHHHPFLLCVHYLQDIIQQKLNRIPPCMHHTTSPAFKHTMLLENSGHTQRWIVVSNLPCHVGLLAVTLHPTTTNTTPATNFFHLLADAYIAPAVLAGLSDVGEFLPWTFSTLLSKNDLLPDPEMTSRPEQVSFRDQDYVFCDL